MSIHPDFTLVHHSIDSAAPDAMLSLSSLPSTTEWQPGPPSWLASSSPKQHTLTPLDAPELSDNNDAETHAGTGIEDVASLSSALDQISPSTTSGVDTRTQATVHAGSSSRFSDISDIGSGNVSVQTPNTSPPGINSGLHLATHINAPDSDEMFSKKFREYFKCVSCWLY